MPYWLTFLFFLVIFILSFIAGLLHWQLYKKRKLNKQRQLKAEKDLAEKKKQAANSLRIIARSYLAEQVELTEACLRICHLLNYVDLDENSKAKLTVFYEISSRIAHIPILDDWKALDRATKAKHRETLEKVESDFKCFAKDAMQTLVDYKDFSP